MPVSLPAARRPVESSRDAILDVSSPLFLFYQSRAPTATAAPINFARHHDSIQPREADFTIERLRVVIILDYL
jgi:hypothetical protein